MGLRILRLKEVKAKTGLSRSSIYGKIAKREFPRQIKLGIRMVGWLEEEIDAWIAEKVQMSR
jgi:prophage regulatory protein